MYRRRDIVEITQSFHCDVRPGVVGVVEDVLVDGYAVRVHANFCESSVVHTSKFADRTLFFSEDQLKRPEVKIQDEKILSQLERLKAELRAKKSGTAWPLCGPDEIQKAAKLMGEASRAGKIK